MEKFIDTSSRRRFLKGLGATALLPLLPSFAEGQHYPRRDASRHRVLCCNIRVALPEDEAKGVGWPQRRALCLEVIGRQQPDIICLQEVLKAQAEDFKKAFPRYQLLGFDGPEMDAHPEGYHGIAKNPILFHTRRYELVAAGGYWLSETPLVAGSLSWDTARARHVNWVRLKDRQSHREFRVLNLHLDHVSAAAKVKGAALVAEESSQYLVAFPQILAGDFNSRAGSPVFETLKAGGWRDSYAAVHGDADPGYTAHEFHGADYPKGATKGKIDFILCKGPVKPLASTILKDQVKGRYPSDHYFLSADLQLMDPSHPEKGAAV
jgi:endonuclease/exonuclease/phosphatase family metal-dependent hydrolase